MRKSGKTEDLWKKQREGSGAGPGYRERSPKSLPEERVGLPQHYIALLYLGCLGSLPR